jgi:hypothetical protein
VSAPLDAWLADGDAPEADWGGHLLRLALRGELGHATDALLVDLPALARPFGCRTSTCTPGLRPPRTRSCCADVDVQLTADERSAITGALDEIAAHLRPHDPRWAEGVPVPFTSGDELARPGGRCVFARPTRTGLRCALHEVEEATGRPRGALKPMPCRLFPLIVVDLGDGRRLLTAVTAKTARHVGLPPARSFPCLRDPGSARPLYLDARDTLEALWGRDGYLAVRRAVLAWRRTGA